MGGVQLCSFILTAAVILVLFQKPTVIFFNSFGKTKGLSELKGNAYFFTNIKATTFLVYHHLVSISKAFSCVKYATQCY